MTGTIGSVYGCQEMFLCVGTQVVSASLTFSGLTEADAKSMETDIKKGIADSVDGVSATDVLQCRLRITKYSSG